MFSLASLELFKKIVICVIVMAAILTVDGLNCTGEAGDKKITVFKSRDAQPYNEALAGFQQFLRGKGIHVTYEVHTFENNKQIEDAVEYTKKNKPDIILALGNPVTEFVCREISDIPVIAALILSRESFKGAKNAAGVFLDFTLKTRLHWLGRFLPETRTVGVIYSSEKNHEEIEKTTRMLRRKGIVLYAQKIASPRELPGALDNLSRRADVWLGLSDQIVLTPQTAKQALLFAFRNGIPFVGLSSAWVKAGALYSLDRDYMDIGMQGGEMAFRLLQGERINSIKSSPPRKLLYSVNLKTARNMRIDIPDELIKEAEHVF